MKKLAIACDHAGVETKNYLIEKLREKGYTIKDFGTFTDESVDYPDFAHPLAKAMKEGVFELGITLCGSGNGINMTANKHQHIRSALCWNVEIAELARAHNDANVCALPARFVIKQKALEIVNAFLSTNFEGGRHQRRVEKIPLG
jgi:ribose 5-phosphate isomerase B